MSINLFVFRDIPFRPEIEVLEHAAFFTGDPEDAMVCTRLDCIGRQAPYDEAMAKKFRG